MHIVIEGLPGGGKTTLSERIARETDFIKIDEMLVPLPDSGDEFLYVEHDIAKTMLRNRYANTVMDRSYISTLGFNHANDIYSKEINFLKIHQRIEKELELGRLRFPDLIIYLSVPVATSLTRQNATNASFWRVPEMLRLSEEYVLAYLRVSKCAKEIIFIDGTQPEDVVYKQVMDVVSKRTKETVYGN